MLKGLLGKIVHKVIVPVVKRAAKEAAEEAIRGEIEKRIGSDGRILTEILVGAGRKPI